MDDKEVDRFERKLWSEGFKLVAGIDEAGRGPLAGPVVAAAVVFPPFTSPFIFRDSKRTSEKRRRELFRVILKRCLEFGIGVADSSEIDRLNILRATELAAIRAIKKLRGKPDFLITDALKINNLKNQINLIKGDERSFSCAAASIIAKVSRDFLMEELDRLFPEYGFRKNKGYPTAEHRESIRLFGASPVHRKSFKGVTDAEERKGGRGDSFPLSVEERLRYFEEKLQELVGRDRYSSP